MDKYWFFGSPLICFGEDSLEFIQDLPGKRFFIVTDEFIEKNLLHHATDKLKKYNKDFKIFSKVMPDPEEEMIIDGLQECNKYNPDMIFAVGGGSSIDTAKAIWILYERPDLNIDDIHPFKILGLGKKAKLVAVPTTSGTGSEGTWATIITRTRKNGTNIKLELANREIIPNYAILDPIFTMGLPPHLTAATAFDALGHAYEGLISLFKYDFSEALGTKSIQLIRDNLVSAYNDGNNLEARIALHNAASISGLCFGNSQVMMGHALAHALGATFHKTHGFCVGLFLPYCLKYQLNSKKYEENRKTIVRLSKVLGVANHSDNDDIAIKKILDDIQDLQEKVKFPRSIKDLDIDQKDFEEKLDLLVELSMESLSSELSVRPASPNDYRKILQYAFEGKEIDW